jgi:hypothetical protein
MSSASTNIGRAIMTMNSGGMVPDLDD